MASDPSTSGSHPQPVEVCEVCGDETAAGSVLFSDRRVIAHRDGARTYVCASCEARILAGKRGTRLSDDELQRAINVAALAGQAWGGHPH